MAEGFDLFKLAGDVGKGVEGFAKGAADAVAGAARAIGEAMQPRNEAEDEPAPEIPAQYRRNMAEIQGFFLASAIDVWQVGGVDSKGRKLADRERAIRMSKRGVELMIERGMFADVAKRLEIRNCAVYVGGDTGLGNPFLNAIEGGYAGAFAGGALNPALVPVGAVAGAVAGAADAFNPRDVWFLDIREFDGTEMTFRLGSKSDGDKLLVFLDSYFSL